MTTDRLEYYREYEKRRKPRDRTEYYRAYDKERLPEKVEYIKDYKKKNPEKTNSWAKNQRHRVIRDVFEAYGAKCNRCGDSNFLHLQLHHKDGDGGERRRLDSSERNTVKWAYANGFPDVLELLCASCHLEHHRLTDYGWAPYVGQEEPVT